MIYLDSNVLLYATLSEVDTQNQQDKAIETLKELIDSETLSFVRDEKENFSSELMQILNNDYAFKNSFDLYHVAFANSYGCQRLLTFDKGFKKFGGICNVEIGILK